MEKTCTELGGRMKQGLREVLVASVPALPLPSLHFQGPDFIQTQRETKQGRAGERGKSLSAALAMPHRSWGGGVGEAEHGAAYTKLLKRLSRVRRLKFYPYCPDSAHSCPHTDFSPVTSLPCPLLYPVN